MTFLNYEMVIPRSGRLLEGSAKPEGKNPIRKDGSLEVNQVLKDPTLDLAQHQHQRQRHRTSDTASSSTMTDATPDRVLRESSRFNSPRRQKGKPTGGLTAINKGKQAAAGLSRPWSQYGHKDRNILYPGLA